MGIRGDFRSHLQVKYPEAFQNVYLKKRSEGESAPTDGKFVINSVAIDLIGVVYSYKMKYDDWLSALEEYFLKMIKNGILPIVVFEGKSPVEKLKEQMARKQKKQLVYDKIANLTSDLEKISITGPSALILQTLSSIRKPLTPSSTVYKLLIEDEIYEDASEEDCIDFKDTIVLIEQYVEKLKKQSICISESDLPSVSVMCDRLNIITLMARGEAEQSCAWLCINGHVDAVVSEDSDLIPLLCPRVLSRSKISGMFNMFTLATLLENCKITKEQLIDWAILCGTDYNTSIRSIGVVTSFKLLSSYGTIENIFTSPAMLSRYKITTDAIEKLDYENVRKLFDSSTLDNDENLKECVKIINRRKNV